MKALCFHETSTNPLDIAIKAITRSQYVHAAVLVDTEFWEANVRKEFGLQQDGHVIIEAIFPKVHARVLGSSELSSIDVFDCPSHDSQKEKASMEWLIEQVQKQLPYDVDDLFRFLPNFRSLMGEATSDSYLSHSFCSMLVFNGYRFGGTKILNCHDFECAPGFLSWSTLLVPCPQLT